MKKAILSIKDLSVKFPDQQNPVLKHISFDLKEGESLGIVGESGSGKSLSCFSILNLLPEKARISSGKIDFFTKGKTIDLLSADKKEMQEIRGNEIGMIFHEPMSALNPVFTIGQQLHEVLKSHTSLSFSERTKKIVQLLEEVKIPEASQSLQKYPYQLSGGQQQRVMIAMAIANEPKLLIADEPTTALDLRVQKSVLSLIKDLQKKYNMSLIFVSHDLDLIKHLCDNVLVMYQGEIVEHGTSRHVLNQPKEAYTKALLHCKPKMNERLLRLNTLNSTENERITISPEHRAEKHKRIYEAEPILEIQNLSISYTRGKSLFRPASVKEQAVNQLSFSVYKGETLGIAGESGSGKSTLGKNIMRLIQEESGAICFHGKELKKLSRNELKEYRSRVQLIFQDPYSSLNPRQCIGDSILEPMRVHKTMNSLDEMRKRVLELLRQTGLEEEHYHRFPHEFSGGQRQRIGIARALSLNPELLILDEAVSALDLSVQAQILNLLNDLKEKFELTYLFISHDLSVVKYMSDRILVMNKGRLEELNEADALFNSPKSDYSKALIQSIIH